MYYVVVKNAMCAAFSFYFVQEPVNKIQRSFVIIEADNNALLLPFITYSVFSISAFFSKFSTAFTLNF